MKIIALEYWTGAERFYAFWVVVLSVILLLLITAIIFIATYTKKENKKKMILAVLTGSLVLIIGGVFGHIHYQPYLEQASYINPLIRDRQPGFMGYTYYGRSDKNFYAQLNDIEALRSLDLYEEKIVTEPVVYLGRDEYSYYFEQENKQIIKYSHDIQFNEDTQPAQFVGSQFELKDNTFEEIGFSNPENIMFQFIEIPTSQQNKSYEPEDVYLIPKADDRMNGWNF